MSEVLYQSQYAPFDGTNIDSSHIVLSSTSNSAPSRQPAFTPPQAFFFGRCVKSMYLSVNAFYETTDGFNLDFGTITAHNLMKRRLVTGSNVCPIKFEAVQNSLATVQFTIDFSQGLPGTVTVAGRKSYTFMPLTQFNVAGAGGPGLQTGHLTQATSNNADGNILLQGFPAFSGLPLPSIGYEGVANSVGVTISNVADQGSSLRLTERIDNIYFSMDGAYPFDVVTITCPAVNSSFDSTAYRSGFEDLSTITIAGISTPLTKGTAYSPTTFVLSKSRSGTDAVNDQATFQVPWGAQTGLITFNFVDTADATKTDSFTSVRPLIIL